MRRMERGRTAERLSNILARLEALNEDCNNFDYLRFMIKLEYQLSGGNTDVQQKDNYNIALRKLLDNLENFDKSQTANKKEIYVLTKIEFVKVVEVELKRHF